MSVIAEIAEKVTESLNAGVFSQTFTATRKYLPVLDQAEMGDAIYVTVVPRGEMQALDSRTLSEHDAQIDVAVQKKVDAPDVSELDPLVDLVEEISDHVRKAEYLLDDDVKAFWMVTEWPAGKQPAAYLQEHLHRMSQFTAVLTLTFRVWRPTS